MIDVVLVAQVSDLHQGLDGKPIPGTLVYRMEVDSMGGFQNLLRHLETTAAGPYSENGFGVVAGPYRLAEEPSVTAYGH